MSIENVSEKITELAKRRGIFFVASEAYGGISGFYTLGPTGAPLKANVEAEWREWFITRNGHMEIDSPVVTSEPVFAASGHLEDFTDMLVECAACGTQHRSDHLVEDETDLEEAESLPTDRIEALIDEHDIPCPDCGTSLSGRPVEDFNLMFETSIGPGDGAPGYLRPETAQGTYVEFPRLKEYARNTLPFAVGQIGSSFRNEINPRKGLIRLREFTHAEVQHFVDPERSDAPVSDVEDVTLRLYTIEQQQADSTEYTEATVSEALDRGIIGNEWVAYYLGYAQRWFERVGFDLNRVRYRQQLPDELAHYASDTWDAEGKLGGSWEELAGFSYRGSHDLSRHQQHADDDFTVFERYDEPRTTEKADVDPNMRYLGQRYGEDAPRIVDELEQLAARNPDAFSEASVTVTVDDRSMEIPTERTGFEVREVTMHGEHVLPHVMEPSFGPERAAYAILHHAYEEDIVEGEERAYLALEPRIAPTTVAVFPLMDRDGMAGRGRDVAATLRETGFAVEYDDSGNIGRRYRRQDEVGTPYCVTVDYDTLEDDTVTVRDRDTTEQVRVPLAELPDTIDALVNGETSFEAL